MFLGRTFTRTLLEHFDISVEQMFYLYIKVFLRNIYIVYVLYKGMMYNIILCNSVQYFVFNLLK